MCHPDRASTRLKGKKDNNTQTQQCSSWCVLSRRGKDGERIVRESNTSHLLRFLIAWGETVPLKASRCSQEHYTQVVVSEQKECFYGSGCGAFSAISAPANKGFLLQMLA